MPPIKAKLVDSLALPGGGSGVVPCLDPLKLTLEYGNAEAWKPPAAVRFLSCEPLIGPMCQPVVTPVPIYVAQE